MYPIRILSLLVMGFFLSSVPVQAELRDQGLNSIMLIIDKAIEDMSASSEEGGDDTAESNANANRAVVNLSKTLGTLSYSRLQCGEAGVLAEFTQRVQKMAEENRDAMRDAFQEGFDQSKQETKLLSEDECKRLTESRNRTDPEPEANVEADEVTPVEEVVIEEVIAEDPIKRYLRIAELTGQLAYKRKVCQDESIFTKDYNEYISTVPDEFEEEVKEAYWKGYKHGKRLNKNLTQGQC
ncbi:MAG: putative secreted protein [Gammaproteobacteria bacterium]|jgi:predicted secreted protein